MCGSEAGGSLCLWHRPPLLWHDGRAARDAHAHAAPAEHAIADIAHARQHGAEGLALVVLLDR